MVPSIWNGRQELELTLVVQPQPESGALKKSDQEPALHCRASVPNPWQPMLVATHRDVAASQSSRIAELNPQALGENVATSELGRGFEQQPTLMPTQG